MVGTKSDQIEMDQVKSSMGCCISGIVLGYYLDYVAEKQNTSYKLPSTAKTRKDASS